MGISRLTAMTIQGNPNDIKCDANGPDDNGKFAGVIHLWKDGCLHQILLDTNFCFESKDVAIHKMTTIVEEVNKLDLFGDSDEK